MRGREESETRCETSTPSPRPALGGRKTDDHRFVPLLDGFMIIDMKNLLDKAIADMQQIVPKLAPMSGPLQKLGEQMMRCWQQRGKVLVAGNGAYTSGGSSSRWVWTTYSGQSAKATARYARFRMQTTGTLLVTALGTLRVNVVARSDRGTATSLSSGPCVVTTSLHFNRMSSITITPKGTASRTSVYDKVEVSGSRGVLAGYTLRFDPTASQYVTIPDSAPLSPSSKMTVEF